MEFIVLIWSKLLLILQHELFMLDNHSITVGTIVLFFLLVALLLICVPKLNSMLLQKVTSKIKIDRDNITRVIRISRIVLFALGTWLILCIVGVDDWVFRQLRSIYSTMQGTLDLKICKLGNSELTLLSLSYILALSFILVRTSSKLRAILMSRYLSKTKMDNGAKQAVASGLHYGLLFVGFVILLQTAGIDLSAMTVMMGAMGIGLSFGLQTITNNLVSGIIILFERPIKIGDLVQIGDVTGEVIDISLRATTVMTSSNIAIVVPNSQFISANVINCTFKGRVIGVKCPVTVSADADPDRIKSMLLEVARKSKAVLDVPPPSVTFDELTKDTLKFSALVWTDISNRETLPSELNFEIARRLRLFKAEAKASSQ